MKNAEVWILVDLIDSQLDHVHLYHGDDDVLDSAEAEFLVRTEKMDGAYLLVRCLVDGGDLLHEILIELKLRLIG